MSSQIIKKFIANNAIDGTKLRFNNDQTARARNAANDADIDLFKLNSSDKLAFSILPQVFSDPSDGNDLVRLSYLNSALEGLKPKEAVKLTASVNVDIATELEAGQSIDGVVLVAGDRVLLIGQTDETQNGIYIASVSGAASRSADMNASSEFPGAYTVTTHGTDNAGKAYASNVDADFDLGTDDATFVLFKSAATLTGGDMITIAGDIISVDLATTSGLESTNPGNSNGQLKIKLEAANPSLSINGSNELAAKLDAAGAIESGANGLAVQVSATGGLEISSNEIQINLEATDPTLLINGSNELAVKFDDGLEQTPDGLAVALDATGALEFNGSDIRINVDSTNSTTKINASNEIESLKANVEQIALDGTDITNQYVDLSFVARSSDCISIQPFGGPVQPRGVAYTVSLTGGAGGNTRITFAGDLATGGAAELDADDTLVISYDYL